MTTDIKKLARIAFPEYKGRTIKSVVMQPRATYCMADYWDGGSRTYVRAVHLETGDVRDAAEFVHNPMNAAAHATFEIPQGIVLVEHSIFCGKDCGLRVVFPAQPAIGPVASEVR